MAHDVDPSGQPSGFSRWFAGRRGRQLREALAAYLFLLPALVIIGTFGLFPLAFSAFQSTLKGLNTFLGKYGGMDNYTKAIGNLAYVLAFWIAAICFFLVIRTVMNTGRTAREHGDRPWIWAVPGAVMAAGLALFVRFTFLLLPEVLDIGRKVRGQQATRELFNQYLGEAWRAPAVQEALRISLLALVVGAAAGFVLVRLMGRNPRNSTYYASFVLVFLLLIGGCALGWFTWTEIERAYAEALEQGEGLEIWSQVVTISAGFVLLIISWWVWGSASKSRSNGSLFLRVAGTALLIVGGWVLIGELPRMVAAGNKDWWQGLLQTVYYSAGTIPFQLAFSLLIAVLLFQKIKGQGLFRLLFFLPYITPTVASAAVFRILFSNRPTAPANSLLGIIGVDPQMWLAQPTGIFQVIGDTLGVTLPDWAGGPSMALGVIIIFNIWTYVGFDTVIFLAGLGSIPGELYEAASIDGAGRWAQFRGITLPLLSPTIYFLILWATIGTFKAFNHIWVLRRSAALGTSDTASVVIFNEFNRNTRYGYASALAVVLLIIILTLTVVNNRIVSKRVFYG
jgi:multiple sugar transport system permease protein